MLDGKVDHHVFSILKKLHFKKHQQEKKVGFCHIGNLL